MISVRAHLMTENRDRRFVGVNDADFSQPDQHVLHKPPQEGKKRGHFELDMKSLLLETVKSLTFHASRLDGERLTAKAQHEMTHRQETSSSNVAPRNEKAKPRKTRRAHSRRGVAHKRDMNHLDFPERPASNCPTPSVDQRRKTEKIVSNKLSKKNSTRTEGGGDDIFAEFGKCQKRKSIRSDGKCHAKVEDENISQCRVSFFKVSGPCDSQEVSLGMTSSSGGSSKGASKHARKSSSRTTTESCWLSKGARRRSSDFSKVASQSNAVSQTVDPTFSVEEIRWPRTDAQDAVCFQSNGNTLDFRRAAKCRDAEATVARLPFDDDDDAARIITDMRETLEKYAKNPAGSQTAATVAQLQRALSQAAAEHGRKGLQDSKTEDPSTNWTRSYVVVKKAPLNHGSIK